MLLKEVVLDGLGYLRWQWFFQVKYKQPLPFLKEIHPSPTEVLWTDYEVHFKGKYKRIQKYVSFKNKTVLALGCGHGEEIKNWLSTGALRCIGVDIQFSEKWGGHKERQLSFIQMMGESLGFKDDCFDIVVSDAVFEHLVEIPAVLPEIKRVLKPEGFFWVSAGPLYYSTGHHGVGAYKHLELCEEAFLKELNEKDQENFVWWEKGMINRYKLTDYLAFFQTEFKILYFGLVLDWRGLVFRRKHPEHWNQLLSTYSEKDLLYKSFLVLLQKRSLPMHSVHQVRCHPRSHKST